MKRKFSFSKLLYHDKLMMLLSLICAVVIWVLVISGPSNISERSISAKVSVDLTNTYAYQSGLRLIGDTEFDVQINVSGTWAVVSRLDESDFRVRPDLSGITGPGDVELALTVSRNSMETDYDILSVTPGTVSVACDYWEDGKSFELQTDLSQLSVSDPDTMRIGEPVLDKTAFPNGSLTIEGPKTVVDQIDSLVARVAQQEVISDIRQYDVPVTALDKNGNEVDISYCSFKELSENRVSLTVPVWVERHIDFGYTLENVPAGIDAKSILTLTPSGIDVLGPSGELDALEKQFENLGTVNFSYLSVLNNTASFDLNIPTTVRVTDNVTTAKVKLDTSGLSTKIFEVTASSDTVTVSGNISAYTVTVSQQKLSGITVVGRQSSIDAITADNLTLTVDVGASPTAGTRQYDAFFKVNGYDDVWVYYGGASATPQLYITLT
ncbi:MAG: YbbR-like domain-containing protein [Acutalibacteraceae bacterium]